MKSQLKWLATATCAAVLSAYAWADITIDNVAALSGLSASGGSYARVQFQLDDERFTGREALGDVVWVKSIGVVQRPDNTIAANSTLRIQQSTGMDASTGISNAPNAAVIAISQPLSASSTAMITVGADNSGNPVSQTLRTYTFAAPFPLKKSTLYTASFYNASGTAANQPLAMYQDETSGTTQNMNTTIHASQDANFSPCVRIIAMERSKLADVGETATWSGLWGDAAPAETDSVGLNVTAANATLTMDTSATVAGLAIVSETAVGPLTFSGTGTLTSTTTSIATDTDVSDITANLGAVTLASGKTLTAKSAADFSSITAGSGATVKYTAPSGSIAKVDNATVELAATAETSGITLPSAGGTYKVSSGTYTGMTLERTGTATTYAFTGGEMTFNGEFSFGKATATISGGTIRAPKMVTVQGYNSRPTSVTQTDGDIILSGEKDGSTTENAVVMFGHWPSATSTYTLSGGSIKAEKGGMRFGNDSSSTLNLSGTGLLKVKGIWGKGTTNCALNLSGGTLSIGSDGFKSIDRLTVTATGGELNAFASNTIAQAITLNGPTTFSAAADCEMTVQGTLSGSGALTIGTETATGTVALGTQRPTLGGIADGAKVKLTATEAELANNAIPFSTTMATAPAKERFTVVKPDGTALTLTAEPTVTDGTLTVTLPQTGGLITATGNWSAAGVSGERVVYVRGGESAESAITVTLDADLSGYTQIAVIGHVKFVTTDTQATLPTTIALERGSVLTANASFSGAYTIPRGTTVVLDGTTAITSASALTVNGALKTQGTVTLSGTNVVPVGGSLSVETGTLTLTASDQSLAGTINIAADATLVNVTGDALAYNGSPVVNVRGTLDMGSTRWTVGGNNVFNVYVGATIKGVGDQHGALDFYNNTTHVINVPNEGDASQPVTISAKLRMRGANDLLKFNIALGNAKVYLTGIVRDAGKLEKAGAGSSRLILSGEAKTYRGATTVSVGYLDLVGGCTLATSGVTVASGAAVTFQADDASTETTYATSFALTGRMDKEGAHRVILSGAITGAGAVNVKNGGLTLDASAATAEAPTAVANPITVGLDTGTAGTLTTKGFLTLSSSSNTVKATGTLTIASGTTVLTTAANAGGIKGKLAIASGATLQCGTGDAPDYNGSPILEIGGTLELTGETRWSIPSGATFTLHSGALLKGTGPASGSNYAFDFFGGAAITADGDATIEANVGSHISDKTLTITQSAGMTTISGEVRNALGLSVAGSGTVVYAPASSVTATSSPLSVSSGATLQLLPAAAFTLNHAVTGAGTLAIGNGTAATAVTLAATGNDAALTVAEKASLNVETGAPPETIVNETPKSIANGKTVTNNGTLTLTSGYGYFNIDGTGKTVVPGSDFLFGIGDANGTAPFSNGLEIPETANFRIRPWNEASSRTIVVVGSAEVKGAITKDGGNATVALQIPSDATIKGNGTVSVPVSFENGGLLDVSLGVLGISEVSGTVTLAGYTGTVVKPVLNTASEVTFAEIPDYTLPKSGESYWLVKDTAKALSAVATENATWSALPWKSSDSLDVDPRIFALGLDLTANVSASAASTPYIGLNVADLDFSKTALTLSGSTLFVLYEGGDTTPANFKSLTVKGVAAVEIAALNNVVGEVSITGTGTLYPHDSQYIFENITEATTLDKALTGAGTVAVLANCAVTMSSKLGSATDDLATFTGNLQVGRGATLTLTSTIKQEMLGDIAIADETSRLVIGNGSQASGLVLKGRFLTGQTASTFGGTLAISANSDFTFASSSAATVTGAVTGTGRLTIGDGSAASTLTLTGALGSVADGVATYAGSLEVAANAELHLKPSVATTLSSAITGAGKVVIGDGTAATQVTQKAVGCDISAIEIADGATYTVSTAGLAGAGTVMLPATTTVKVAEGGKLVVDTTRQMNANVTGKGEVEVMSSTKYVFAADQTNRLAPGKLTLKSGLVLHAARDNDTGLSVNELTFENAALSMELAKSVTTKPVVTVAANQVLSGEGTITVPIVFEDGAIFDAKGSVAGGALRLTGADITWPESGTVTVRATEPVNLMVFAAEASEHFTLEDSATALDLYLSEAKGFVGEDVTMSVLKKLGTDTLPTEVSENDAVKAAIQKEVDAWAGKSIIITEVTAITTKNTVGEAKGSVQAVDCFTNLETTLTLTPNEAGGYSTTATAVVTYDFGVSQITVKKAQLDGDAAPQLYVLACAKVSNGKTEEATAAGYADGTKVSLLLDGTEAAGAVALETTTLSNKFGVTAGLGEQWFALPMKGLELGTREFTVHAKNTPKAEVTP